MKKLLKFLYLLLRSGQPRKAWFFASWQGAANPQLLATVRLLPGRRLQYLPTGAVFSESSWRLFGQSLLWLQRCAQQYAATETDGQLWLHTQLHGHAIRARMANHESVQCMHEVFGLHAYQVLGTGPCVVVDVGMNIGLASLYMAALPQVTAVYGFELIDSSADFAADNIRANPHAAGKVLVHCAGVAAASGEVRLPPTGVGDVGAHLHMQGADLEEGVTTVLSLASVIDRVVTGHPGLPIVLKLDCEGAEYEIVQRIQSDALHQHISALMIEWHVKGSQPLSDVLTACGYTCFTPGIEAAQPTGFVYAVKNNASF